MHHVITAFGEHLAARRAPRTKGTYTLVLSLFADFTKIQTVSWPPDRRVVEAFLNRPKADGESRSPATYNQELAALRAFFKFAQQELGWQTSPVDGIPFLREPPRDPPVLSAPEIRRLFFAAAETSPPRLRSRNLAILAVLSQVGLRVHELVALDLNQVDLMTVSLVGIHGKGGTVHDLPLNGPTVALITAWLADRAQLAAADEPALFVSARGVRVQIRAVQRLMVKLRLAMGTPKRIVPHTLRHSAATLALTLGTDLSTVAELLRHSDLNTTRRYLHLVDERRREAVRKLAVAIPPEVLELGSAPVPNEAIERPIFSTACPVPFATAPANQLMSTAPVGQPMPTTVPVTPPSQIPVVTREVATATAPEVSPNTSNVVLLQSSKKVLDVQHDLDDTPEAGSLPSAGRDRGSAMVLERVERAIMGALFVALGAAFIACSADHLKAKELAVEGDGS